MAFALTGSVARGIDIAGPNFKRGIQQVTLRITGLAANVDLDIGDQTGNFWTQAQADGTYGTLATKVLNNVFVPLASQVTALLAVKSPQLLDRVQVATLAANGEYTLAVDALGPNIAVFAGDGETSFWYIVLEWELNDNIPPIVASYWPS